ncbi:small-conductance mechanosensitive channel [Cupriavidus gilardii J11]|uniref:Small-conductance mechanosensitive channel n=1 Tax=Cupriavidus gilardii J11 TaxID=936133 RepID=A0A562BPI9_9BURK|nr:mechanosensitive ion channel domain-containing protein [Cupriavidus gilardii]TWG87198.1 small-conductance mechanosensitive channel [Cupriavidus gilardii J11]
MTLARLIWLALAGLALAAWTAHAATPPVNADATASSPPASAPLAQSLDQVIRTLKDDTQRSELLHQLEAVRAGIGAAPASEAVAADDSAPGLVGAIADAVEQVDDRLRKDQGPWHYWSWRLRFAGEEWQVAFARETEPGAPHAALLFAAVLGGWAAAGLALHMLARRAPGPRVHHAGKVRLPTVPSWTDVGIYMLRRVGPWAVAFGAAAWTMSGLGLQLPAGVAAMAIAYALVAGAVLSAVSQTLFAVFRNAHRARAVRDLHDHSRPLLFAIGTLAALGDAGTNNRVIGALGPNLAAVAGNVCNIAAALLMAWFCVRFRRQIGHLIANRPLAFRQTHPAITDLLRLTGGAWYLPVLLVVIASVTGTLLAAGQADDYLRRTIISVALIVAAMVLTVFTGRSPRSVQIGQPRRWQRRSAYVARFGRFAMVLLRLAIWIAFLEIASRVWGHSLYDLMRSTELGRRFGDAVFGALATVLLAWLFWLVIDTAIMQALSPGHGRGPHPSLRAKTILPLLRNALLVGLLTIVLIAVLANIGVNVTPLLAGAGVVGLAIGFGAQTLVQDLITGLFIVIEDSVAIGDVIELADHSGVVEGMTIRTVKLRDGKGALHILPYSQIKVVKNLSRGHAFAVFQIALRYDSDLDRAVALMREAGAEIAEDVRYAHQLLSGLDILGLDRFDPNGPVVMAQFKTRPLAQFEITRAFNASIKQKFDAAGIRMATPYMTLQIDRGGSGLLGADGEQASALAGMSAGTALSPGPSPASGRGE